jgi:hypothetical protein
MSFPAEHYGKKNTRKWYKVKWVKDGKLDLLIDEDYEKCKNHVTVLKEIKTDKCAEGLRKINSEKDIDEWIEQNVVR